MYVYQIVTYWYNEEIKDNVYGHQYVTSEKKYSYEEFEALCEEARSVLGKDTWDINDYLIENHGFESMPIEARFEYDPYEE